MKNSKARFAHHPPLNALLHTRMMNTQDLDHKLNVSIKIEPISICHSFGLAMSASLRLEGFINRQR